MRLLVVLMLSAASLGFGFDASARLKARCNALESISKIILQAENSLRFFAHDVKRIFHEIAGKDNGLLSPFANALVHDHQNEDFHLSFKAAIQMLPMALTKKDIEILSSFGDGLGKSDLIGQLALCELTQKQINEQLNEAKTNHQRLSKLYINLGALCGVAFAVLLF